MQAQLELGCTIWWGYLPSATGEGGLFICLLARMPASSALSDACSRVTVYWGLYLSSPGLTIQLLLYLCSVSMTSVNFIFFPQVTHLPFAADM